MSEVTPTALPAIHFLHFDDAGIAYLQGTRCGDCGVVAPGERRVCNACGARRRMSLIRLADRGTLYTYTIVHRSFPGIKTPFVAAIVDLEGGGAVKGTLLNTQNDPQAIPYGMPVKVVYRDTGQRSSDGRPFISYYFEPIQGGLP